MATPALTATVDTRGARNVHRLLLDDIQVDRRTSATRRYTHVLAVESAVHGWVAWSWHLTEAAANAAARGTAGARCVVAIVEVSP